MSNAYDHLVDKAFHGLPLESLLAAPVEALAGVSSADAERLRQSFGIRTIRDLADSRYFRAAAGILNAAVLNHDPGPPPGWAEFFQAAPVDYYVNHPAGRFRLDFGPVYYRGRLDGSARVLVIGQDPSTNEILGHRILVGTSGQRVQGFLEKAGITRSYVMLNTFLFSVFGQFNTELRKISEEPEIDNFRNAFLNRIVAENHIQAVVTFGVGARHGFERWPGKAGLTVFHATHPAAEEPDVIASWNEILPALRLAVTPDDGAPEQLQLYGAALTDADNTPIPRFDLPFTLPDWFGVGGGHSARDGNDKIIWNAP
jgi:hypothetical protein